MLEQVNLVRDLAERRAEHAEHAYIFGKAIARRLPVDVGNAEAQPLHQPLLEFPRMLTVGSLRANGADHASNEQPWFELPQALVVAPHLGQPDRAFVAKRNRQRLHAVRTADHWGSAM